MRPTDVAIETSLARALACAEFRIPRAKSMSTAALDLTTALRFGLIGIGASHHILRDLPRKEQANVYPALRYYGGMVSDHLQQSRYFSAAHQVSPEYPRFSRNLYGYLFDRYLALRKLNGSLDVILDILAEEFVRDHSYKLASSFLIFRNRAQERVLEAESKKSTRFALSFAERCEMDLDEVPEIALIGE